MKQKRTIITLGLILAILCLGIVYAAIDGIELNINGSASALLGNGVVDVIFTSANAGNGSENFVTEVAVGSDPKTATFTVEGLQNKGDTATIEFVIENQSEDIPVTLGEPVITQSQNGEWFEVNYSYVDNELTVKDGENDETTLVLTVKLLKVPTTEAAAADAKENITVKINANPASNADTE